ncbi:unnamed protein product, partial [Ectocarpus sp. 12 AP-2014]
MLLPGSQHRSRNSYGMEGTWMPGTRTPCGPCFTLRVMPARTEWSRSSFPQERILRARWRVNITLSSSAVAAVIAITW